MAAFDTERQREHDDINGHDPDHGAQQDAAHDHGCSQTEPAPYVLLVFREAIRGDCNEDEIVDAEGQFQEHEDDDLAPSVDRCEGRKEACEKFHIDSKGKTSAHLLTSRMTKRLPLYGKCAECPCSV